MNYHHSSNSYLVNSDLNLEWYDLFLMSDAKFKNYVSKLKNELKKSWQDYNQPPRKTYSDDEIISQMRRISSQSVENVLEIDDLTQTKDCVY